MATLPDMIRVSVAERSAWSVGWFVSFIALYLYYQTTFQLTIEYTMTAHVKVNTVYPKKYAHAFVVLCFVVVMQSFIMNSHEVFIHIHQGCFAGTGAIVRLPQCQWSKPDGYGKISQCITTTKHSKAKTVCIFLGIYCTTRHVFYIAVVSILREHIYTKSTNFGRHHCIW